MADMYNVSDLKRACEVHVAATIIQFMEGNVETIAK